ncbi:hypothetical protein P4S64_01630 [Vibrio sp. M60_M31a]
MKLLYWLDEWRTYTRIEQRSKLPISGFDLLDDVYVRYELVDPNKPLLFTFSPSGTDVQVQDLNPNFKPWGYQARRTARSEHYCFPAFG